MLMAGGAFGQRYSFKFYGQENGLVDPSINVLLQNRTGFLWAGTENGLFRYDGRHFQMFTVADGLRSMQVYALAEAADGALWVGSVAGLARLKSGRFERVDLSPAKGTRAIAT